jgi:hypothetical protein
MNHKTKVYFQDYFMQKFYEGLVKRGVKPEEAVKETVKRFGEYDEEA